MCSTHSLSPSSAKTDDPIKGVVIGVNIGFRRVHAYWSSSNYLAKTNSGSKEQKFVPIEMRGRLPGPSVGTKVTRIELTEVYCMVQVCVCHQLWL